MKNKLIKLLSLSLAILMLSVAFVSCKKEEAPVETGTVSTTGAETETDIYEGLRDLDYGGKKFRILTYDIGVAWTPYIMQVEDGAQVLNDAVMYRNNEVQELLNVQIETIPITKEEIPNHIFTTTTAQLVDYDLVYSYATNSFAQLLTGDYLYNVKKVENMKLDKPWYNQSANQNFTLKKKQYFFVSDFSLPIQQRFAFLANNKMLEDYKVFDQFEGVENIYDLVNQGKWDIDNLQLMIKNINPDTAGDDFNGTSGFVTNENATARFLNNWGEDIVSTEYVPALDTNRLVFNLNGSILDAMVARLTSLIHDDNNVYFEGLSKNDPKTDDPNSYYEIFKRGDALFSTYSSDPYNLAKDAKYESITMAYLPYPKYTGQDNYVTVTHGGLMMFSSYTADIAFSGAVTEALSAASYKFMVNAYMTDYFELGIIDEVEGIEMYKIILDTAYYDIARYVDPTKGNNGEQLCVSMLYFSFLIRSKNTLDWRFNQHGTTITTAYTDLYSKLPTE